MSEIFVAVKFPDFAFFFSQNREIYFSHYTLKTVNRYTIAISIQSLLKNVSHITHYSFKRFLTFFKRQTEVYLKGN